MTDQEKLSAKIKASGLKINHICQQIGLSYPGFYKKLYGLTEFKAGEIEALCQILGIGTAERMQIFFAHNVEKNSTPEA